MSQPFILLISDDLFFGSRITAAAQDADITLVTDQSGSLARLGDTDCLGVLFDLEHRTMTPASIAAVTDSGTRLVAYGPHVHVDLFAAAKVSGFETVTRGQLSRDAGAILKSFVTA